MNRDPYAENVYRREVDFLDELSERYPHRLGELLVVEAGTRPEWLFSLHRMT
jgi:hypothetical protein